ncbi:PD-(D/E)XK motif protein [Marinobacter shengliensis]|uniref:PD-(D/E)XK motif protein n=1 Tax=Marinobacter shengliensis TaxID=1389223 RepID=UPI001E4B19C4|nr:PD-(D/E)XK motif protein [Marinobacter shengliensis]MCD1631744.1 PD-(D/E)XK motif protein [Marinobacter shengliensis]
MADVIDHILETWESLLDEPGTGSQSARYRISGSPRFGAYLAIRFDDRAPVLEFGPITPDLLKDAPLPSIKGVDSGLSYHNQELFLSLTLKQPASIDIFLTLAGRLTDELSGVDYPITGYNVIRKVLVVWRAFFSSEKKILSGSEQIGLAGELILARMLMDSGIEEPNVIRAWKGSERSHHDFQLPLASVEVKATIAHNIEIVSISSLRQLDPTGTQKLFLAQVAMDSHDHGEQTLPQLVKDMRQRLSSFPADRLEFEEKLLESGYRDKDESNYAQQSFQVRKVRAFSVNENFPKLTHDSIPRGVVEATYQINLGTVASQALTFEDFMLAVSSNEND